MRVSTDAPDVEDTSELLFNLPFTPVVNRSQVYSKIVSQFAEGRSLDILEIGVYKAGLLRGLKQIAPECVLSYTGVDPYIGDETDPYHRSYWAGDKQVAVSQYEESKAIYDSLDARLIRQKSEDFFAENNESYDIIIVDGDHRLEPARKDLHAALGALRPGGLLICDDYGNSDTPEVTRAVVHFVKEAGDFYDAAGYRPIWFMNINKPAPIQLSAIYWRKKGPVEAKKKGPVEAKSGARSVRTSRSKPAKIVKSRGG